MPTGLTSHQLEQMLRDPWLFSYAGRLVEVSLIFEEPERVQLISVGGSPAASIEWDALADLLHADERGSDVVDQRGLQELLARILDNPPLFGATVLE
jgi:hypothetical protein